MLTVFTLLILFQNAFSMPAVLNPEEGNFFEGDIMNVELNNGLNSKTVATLLSERWVNGVVPYAISTVYSENDVKIIKAGMKMVEDQTKINGEYCVRFVERTDEENFVSIENGSGCSSYVGNIEIGPQRLSLKKPTATSPGTCLVTGIVAHEFLHALGIWHEQSRFDRDDYIDVLFENIQSGTEHNFNKYPEEYVDVSNQKYDYSSIMHYASTAFSKNGKPTIVAKNGAKIGQREMLSDRDVEGIRNIYKCWEKK